MKNLEQTEKSPSLSYQNPPGAWQRGERASEQHLLPFSEKKLLSETFPKKKYTCWGMEEKSPCLLGGGTSEPKGNSFAGTHMPRTPLVGFCHCCAPVGLTPSAKQLLPPPACPTPNTTPCKRLPRTSSPEQLEGNRSDNTLHQTTQVEPNEFVSAWTNTSYHMGNGAPAGPPCPLLGLTPVFN